MLHNTDLFYPVYSVPVVVAVLQCAVVNKMRAASLRFRGVNN